MATVIECPTRWDSDAAIEFGNQIAPLQDVQEVATDFRRVDFAYPFGALLIAESLRKFVRYRKDRGLRTVATGVDPDARTGNNAITYLKHVGFFRFIGLPFGKDVGEAKGSPMYTPITLIQQADLASYLPGMRLQIAIQEYSKRLANVVTTNEFVGYMLTYGLREIIRNVFEHSKSDKCIVMAQRYERLGYVEVAAVDEGIGILATLREAHDVETAEQAIDLALLPGVSRKLDTTSDDEWANSGFGLYVLSQLGIMAGGFEISSSGVHCRYQASGKSTSNYPCVGTGISVRLTLRDVEYFSNVLEDLSRRGESEAFQRTGIHHRASKGSVGLWG